MLGEPRRPDFEKRAKIGATARFSSRGLTSPFIRKIRDTFVSTSVILYYCVTYSHIGVIQSFKM